MSSTGGGTMKAITLVRPWPFAILHAGKRIENRSWTPHRFQLSVGSLLAIHAGSKWDQDGADWIDITFGIDVPPKSEHVAGAIVGIVRYAGIAYKSPDPWFFGPVGWVLEDVRAIEPIPHRGALGLWTPDDAAQIRLMAVANV